MAEKFAIYFGEPLACATAGYEGTPRSARVNHIAHEWLAMIEDNVPALAPQEWQAVMAATTSAAIADDNTLRLLWAAVADAGPECAAHGIDADDLAAKLRGLSLTQRYALRETLERAWAALEAGEELTWP